MVDAAASIDPDTTMMGIIFEDFIEVQLSS